MTDTPKATAKRARNEKGHFVKNDATSQAGATNTDEPARPPKRVPFGNQSLKLDFPEIPGFHQHIFNDQPGRIERAKAAGYEHVRDEKGEPIKKVVGVAAAGGEEVGYLMKIPQEYYDEDFAAQQAEIDKVDENIRRGAMQGEPGHDGRYVPEESGTGKSRIKIQ